MKVPSMSIEAHVFDNINKYIVFDLMKTCRVALYFPILSVGYDMKDDMGFGNLLSTTFRGH
jgi:hypothetical protein